MEMLLCGTEENCPIYEGFYGWRDYDFRVEITHGKTAETPTGAFLVGSNEDKAF